MKEFFIRNTEEAIKFWATVSAKSVVEDLCGWRVGDKKSAPSCDSPACFGGHLPYASYFAALGVTVCTEGEKNEIGQPVYEGKCGPEVAGLLFGDYTLFNKRESWESNCEHEAVTDRLYAHLAHLQQSL